MKSRSLIILIPLFIFTLNNCSKNTSPVVDLFSPSNGSTDISDNATISVTFNKTMNPTTITTNTEDTTCSGSIQVSSDNFNTCVQMIAAPAASNEDKTFTVTPSGGLEGLTEYKVRVTGSVEDLDSMFVSVTTATITTGVREQRVYFYITSTTTNGNIQKAYDTARLGADYICANDANRPQGLSNYHAYLNFGATDRRDDMVDNYSIPSGRVYNVDNTSVLWDNVTYIDNGTVSQYHLFENTPYSSAWTGVKAQCSHVSAPNCVGWTSDSQNQRGAVFEPSYLTSPTNTRGFCSAFFYWTTDCDHERSLYCLAW